MHKFKLYWKISSLENDNIGDFKNFSCLTNEKNILFFMNLKDIRFKYLNFLMFQHAFKRVNVYTFHLKIELKKVIRKNLHFLSNPKQYHERHESKPNWRHNK